MADESQPAGGSYEVLRARLLAEARTLEEKATKVNARRKEIFGGAEHALIANERVRTENACVPRDMVSVAGHMLFGFEVFLGLREETRVADVLAAYKFERTGDAFDLSQVPFEGPLAFLANAEFQREVADVFRYMKGARLTQLRHTETRLLVAMQIGASARDVKVLRFSVDAKGAVAYVDARGEEDYAPPKPHDFAWKLAGRDAHVAGKFPHVNVLDEVFVDTVGGDLTVKVENNTKEGQGIYREPVDDGNQTLDDAEVWFAKVGALVLLRVKPFRELAYRHLVVDVRRRRVARVDAIGAACLSLPEGHGVVFPGGVYLETGEHKIFDGDDAGMTFERVIKAPNGEDVAYVFYRDTDGQYLILHYNLIRREVEAPLRCNGYSLFPDGTLTVFRASSEPTRTHPVQVWRTPFTSADWAAQIKTDGSYLAKVGNAELVRGVSDALQLARQAANPSPTRQSYEELVRAVGRLLDGAYWFAHAEADDLASTARAVGKAAEAVLDEFEKIEAIRARAREQVEGAKQRLAALEQEDVDGVASVDGFLVALTDRRRVLGEVLSLRELREVDVAAVDALETGARAAFDRASAACVKFLLGRDAFAELCQRLDRAVTEMDAVTKVSELAPYAKDLETVSSGLSLLAEVISGLKVDDATARTKILESVSAAFAQQNRARATLDARKKELGRREGEAELGVQLSLLSQSVSAALSSCDTPERTQEELAKILLTIEEIEGRFGELDEVVVTLTERRQEVQDAFGARRQALLDERQRRAAALSKAAARVLAGIVSRARTLGSPEELNAYFASDPTVMRVNDLRAELLLLGDTVRAEELATQLASARQDARRKLRDDRDLGGEEGTVRFGAHAFRVTKEPLDLVLVPREGGLAAHLTGTDYFEPITDELIEASRDLWDDTLVSESAEVYRAEYLAVSIFLAAEAGEDGLSVAKLREEAIDPARLLALVRGRAEARIEEGYERGVHDADAARILERVLHLAGTVGLMRYSPDARAAAVLWWVTLDPAARDTVRRRARAATRLADELGDSSNRRALVDELGPRIGDESGVGLSPVVARSAAAYLIAQISREQLTFTTSPEAVKLLAAVVAELEALGGRRELALDLPTLPRATALALCRDHVVAHASRRGIGLSHAWEAAALWLTEGEVDRYESSSQTSVEVTGLLGRHPRVRDRALTISLDELLPRVVAHATLRAPRFVALRKHKLEVAARERARLRLSELVPRVLTSFVRNRLVDEVLLPLVGKNLAKQIGDASSDARTDRMGMLLLVSPPGYGKTTLMEYVAEKLGLVFVKVNGPALGHAITSLDPADAKSATARQEVDKINLALEMGQNVMLYLDDIQHTSPELLQKFISLCDGQRRIEGVWRGTTRTYDLRGKRFCVVMAGNPYTESGELFRIPDMLANRADTYNLGDVLGGQRELFALSYLENSLTSSPALSPLAARDPKDLHQLVRMARGEPVAADALSQGYSGAELAEMTAVVARLMKVQELLLRVNQAYVESASKDDAYRTEPPFKLQGSYRNMAKIAARVVAAMNDEELERLLDDHYKSEAQTLTTSAEQNLLLLAELRGRISPEGAARLAAIREEYQRKKRMGGAGDDPVARVTGTLSSLDVQLKAIREAITAAGASRSDVDWQALSRELVDGLRSLSTPRLDVSLDAGATTELGLALSEHAATLRELLSRIEVGGASGAGWEARLSELVASLSGLEGRLRAASGPPPTVEVTLSADGDHNFYVGIDGGDPLVHGGLFVATYERPPALGAALRLQLTFPGGAAHAAEGHVAWRQDLVDDDGVSLIPGFGVRMTRYEPALTRAAAEFVAAREPMLREA
ncbi:MAG: DNA repair ATPase [Polyangiaceae bacterium]|nr:DNA repair ATPase [Polyangiaceae bacterium]